MAENFRDDEDRSRFKLDVGGAIAFITYRKSPGAITLVHTEVPPELGGQGVGSKLGRATLDAVRAEGWKLKAWSAAPINAFSLWPSASVRITKGEAEIATFHKTENSYRKYCKICGGHLMTDHPRMRLIDVYANLLQGFVHEPTLHANYGSKMVSVKDGLPKYRDLPAELGGSGEVLPD